MTEDFLSEMIAKLKSSNMIISLLIQPPKKLAKMFDDLYPKMSEFDKSQLYIMMSLNTLVESGLITESHYRIMMNIIQDIVIDNARKNKNQGGNNNESPI